MMSPTPALKSTMSLPLAAQALCQFSLACLVGGGERFGWGAGGRSRTSGGLRPVA